MGENIVVNGRDNSIFDWPGKSNDQGKERPAILHMLDVMACAERLIPEHTAFRKLSDHQIHALLILIALHDVGKISESFRALIRNKETGAPLHWELSDFLLRNDLDDILSKLGTDKYIRDELYAAVAGHHGKPPTPVGGNRREKRKRQQSIGNGLAAAKEWITRLLKIFPNASLGNLMLDEAKALSWALSGLTVAADWLGSNEKWFPVEEGLPDIQEALEESRSRAILAVHEAGLDSPPSATFNDYGVIGLNNLRPMQLATSTIELAEGPHMAIIEDATGSGKTEAALILAHRMMTMNKARGLFFALPTMATSNAMFERMVAIAPKLFLSSPSVVLTHSRAKLSAALRELDGTTHDKTPEAENATWLTDSRRRSLLATVGVGTIDQALLGILPTRFSTLRLFGLADKILIVDEAHSYDPYMQKQLEALLQMQARLNGSVILMTASLPLEMRQAYVDAFREGMAAKPTEVRLSTNYPGLHLMGRESSCQIVKPHSESIREVKVYRLEKADEAMNLLEEATKSHAACVWIRNTVDDAIESAQLLKQRGLNVDLLHARFAMDDRLRHEQSALNRFGKKGTEREGRILVATQVVEASLDLDFDVMISDLAPIGSLIQRAGRLWRHMHLRSQAVRPVASPTLHVLSPDPEKVGGEDWLHKVLDRGAWVYRLDDQWRTAKTLFDSGKIVEPGNLRNLIEAVHGATQIPIPEILDAAQQQAVGEAFAEAGLAINNIVEGETGFRQGTRGAIGKDSEFPTRLGEPQVLIVLARRTGNGLIPWANNENQTVAWSLSEVSASRHRFESLLPNQESPEIRTVKSDWPEWRRHCFNICPVGESGMIAEGIWYDSDRGLLSTNNP